MISQPLLAAAVEGIGDARSIWLFGSEAAGRATSESDIDLGVLFDRSPSLADLIDMRLELEETLGRTVDLVDMRACSPIVAMQIVTHGRLLVDRDPVARAGFVASLPSRRYDVMRVRRAAEEKMLARVTRG